MPVENQTTDIKWLTTGDIGLAPNGDFAITRPDECLYQEVVNRLYTEYGDWLDSRLGSNIANYIGEPNTRETGAKIEREIVRALTYDGRFRTEDLSIRIVPISEHDVLAYITVETLSSFASLILNFNFVSGITVIEGEPSITSIAPDHGPTRGGTYLSIRGDSLTNVQHVYVGGAECTDLHIVNDAVLSCRNVLHAVGLVDVVMATLTSSFTYANKFRYE